MNASGAVIAGMKIAMLLTILNTALVAAENWLTMKVMFDMQRTLEITIRFNDDDFEVDVYEPESGEISQIQHPYSPGEHPEFDKAIGDEIYSWISLWKDEDDDEVRFVHEQ